jgi:protein-S-isoprenylcysteine O-methyltransferase Ste14
MRSLELKVPPVALVLAAAGLMWLSAHFAPSLAAAVPSREAIALALAGLGLAFAGAGVLAFRQAKTTVNPTRPEATSSIVASGVYGLSRNPMYLGFLFALSGWAVFLANLLAILVLPLFVAYLTRFQIVPEERALSTRFGAEYGTYMRKVRRWI